MRILAFGAHPDDIEVGMGGTIARYTEAEHNVIMIIAMVPNKQDRYK